MMPIHFNKSCLKIIFKLLHNYFTSAMNYAVTSDLFFSHVGDDFLHSHWCKLIVDIHMDSS